MPFPYELYPKAKETHCLNLPEISVSRPPFPGSIRTADGCFWGERNNNSYVSDNGNTYLGSGYYWSDVFEEYTTADARMECGSVPNNGRGCYIGCTCKSGWDGKKTYGAASSGLNQTGTINANSASTSNPLSAANVLDAAPSATSAAGNYSATASAVVVSSSASGINSGISAMAAGGSCTISLTDPRYGTTCSKSGTFACPSGYGYSLDSCKKNQETKYQVCSVDSTQTNSTPCYSAGTAKTCSDEGYFSSCSSGQTCTDTFTTPCGNACCKSCKNEDCYYKVSVEERIGNTSATKIFVASLDSHKWSHPAISVTIRIWVNTQSGGGNYRAVTATIPVGSQSGSGSLTLSNSDDFYSDWYIESVSPSSYDYGNGTTCTVSF